ncbi:MAG: efflux RND transporter periplasmic adaptor subunit [Eubacteriaceae bacterium]|nr:efflux RND transporter periplasmic adaptor subunit [Eubacteriaceae bacterium]
MEEQKKQKKFLKPRKPKQPKKQKIKKERQPWSKKKKITVGVIIGIVAVVAVIVVMSMIQSANSTVAVNSTALAQGELQRTVSTTGTVESTNTEYVADSTGLPVWTIDVAVGNWVEKGSRLCQLYNEHGTTDSEKWVSVYATATGTVTAINAKVGVAANGNLFTIENTNSLRVAAKIKQSDLGSVRSGMPVIIKTDATGDKEYTGTLQSIAPAATSADSTSGSSSTGGITSSTSSSSNPEFKGIVSIDSDITDLCIGMKTQLNIVVEDKQDVFNVDYSAVTTDDNGNNCVYTAVDANNGVYTVKKIMVTTGTESDFAVEITGDGLVKGMPIIADPSKVKDGDKVTLTTTTSRLEGEDRSNA